LKPVVARNRGKVSRTYFRADADFAHPEVYEFLEANAFETETWRFHPGWEPLSPSPGRLLPWPQPTELSSISTTEIAPGVSLSGPASETGGVPGIAPRVYAGTKPEIEAQQGTMRCRPPPASPAKPAETPSGQILSCLRNI
jgi:hypothetical protein